MYRCHGDVESVQQFGHFAGSTGTCFGRNRPPTMGTSLALARVVQALFRRPFVYLGPAMLLGVLLPVAGGCGANVVLVAVLAVLAVGFFGPRTIFPLAAIVGALLLGHASRLNRPSPIPFD